MSVQALLFYLAYFWIAIFIPYWIILFKLKLREGSARKRQLIILCSSSVAILICAGLIMWIFITLVFSIHNNSDHPLLNLLLNLPIGLIFFTVVLSTIPLWHTPKDTPIKQPLYGRQPIIFMFIVAAFAGIIDEVVFQTVYTMATPTPDDQTLENIDYAVLFSLLWFPLGTLLANWIKIDSKKIIHTKINYWLYSARLLPPICIFSYHVWNTWYQINKLKQPKTTAFINLIKRSTATLVIMLALYHTVYAMVWSMQHILWLDIYVD